MNFLPEQDKLILKKEYLKRLFVLFSLFVIFVILAAGMILAPVGLVILTRKDDLKKELSAYAKNAEKISGDKSILKVKDLNHRIGLLSNYWSKQNLNTLIMRIVDRKKDGIQINSFSYENKKGDEINAIIILGKADTRQNLFAFESRLKKEFGEQNVISPISNLVKERDLNFSLTISTKNKK